MSKRPTQKDVGRLAGVSRATVSYVINNRAGGTVRISETTRRRVWDAVEELGYQPNVTARSLRTRRTQLMAVMVPDLTNPFYPLLIRGAQMIAHEQDYQILVYDCDDRSECELAFVDAMLRRWVDGVILIAFHLKADDIARLTKDGIQVVQVISAGESAGLSGVDVVVPEERMAIFELVRYLTNSGHRRIAHLAGRQDTPPGRVRLQGYREALAEFGVPYDESLVRHGTFRSEGVEDLVLSLFPHPKREDHPTALFAANDVMAIEAIRVLGRHGWQVPEEVAVCGFDNIPEAEVVVPSLTTVDQDPQFMGREAAELLLERLDSQEPVQTRNVATPCRLVIRRSA